jgi:hypothetical protein
MKRTILGLILLTVMAFGAVTWVEDTAFRSENGKVGYSGRRTLTPGDTTPLLSLPYYPWTQLWAYALLDTLPGRGATPIAQLQWRWGTYDAYTKTRFYYSEWQQALPSIWCGSASGDSMTVEDSLYLGPLYDTLVPLAWVDRVQFRVVCDTGSDTCSVRFWVRRRTFTEAGDVLQWPQWRSRPN